MAILQTYTVTGMTCGHCEAAVREEVGELPGVDEVTVSSDTGRLDLLVSEPIDDAVVIAAVDEAGYVAERSW